MELDSINGCSFVLQAHNYSTSGLTGHNEVFGNRGIHHSEGVIAGCREGLWHLCIEQAVIMSNQRGLAMHQFFSIGHRGTKSFTNSLVA